MLTQTRCLISKAIAWFEARQPHLGSVRKVTVLTKSNMLLSEVDHALSEDFKIVASRESADAIITDQWLTFLYFLATKKYVIFINRNLYKANDALKLRDLSWKLKQLNKSELCILERNQDTFDSLIEDHTANVCLLLGTGPNLNILNTADIPRNETTIVACNSIVRDQSLLSKLGGIEILCFADPVFHFSSSAYCSQFMRDVKLTIEQYNPYIVVPMTAFPLAQKLLGGWTSKLVGLAHSKSQAIPTYGRPQVEFTPNIMTALMLPLAGALTSQLLFAGFDGRDPKESYFWKHNSRTQYEPLMQGVFQQHPSFLRDQDLGKYYEDHLLVLERKLLQMRKIKNISWRSLTPTFISILESSESERGLQGSGSRLKKRALFWM